MSVRDKAAVLAGRATRLVLHDLLHRHATQLPGRVTLGLDPEAISRLSRRATSGSIVVCGTNGKTTTTNLIACGLERAGLRVACNRDGANMASGVTSALLGKGTLDWAVMEVDELSSERVVSQMRPTYLVLLNLFRDQLDRAGEIDHVQDVLASALAASPETTLVVCADDPLSVGVAERSRQTGTRAIFFGMSHGLDSAPDRVTDAGFCQRCGTRLTYAFRSFAQLGDFSCPTCGFARPALDFAAKDVRGAPDGISLTLAGPKDGPWHLRSGLAGAYAAYDLAAAAAAASLAGVTADVFQEALDTFSPANGRLQHFVIGGREVTLNLAKNPAGLNQNISLMLADSRPKALFCIINDEPNDGRDVSWLWDVDFERLATDEGMLQVSAGGLRAHDLKVRLKYAGVTADIAGSLSEALGRASALDASCPLYVLCNYSALWGAKAELERLEARHV